ncbi:hypothetical protein HY024_00495 [Candidatus Curtissbacteria bacterium]|nr:hypothetical protein [Candidatus Curtissbacteria bacterium]
MTFITDLSSKELLTRSWKSVYSGKTKSQRKNSKGVDNISLYDFKEKESEKINNLFLDIKKGKYEISPLHGFIEPKPGKQFDRLICVPTTRDRIIHKSILGLINRIVFPHINTGVSYCGINENLWGKNKNPDSLNTKKAVKVLIKEVEKGNFWVFKADIEGFYDNISRLRLLNKIRKILDNDSSLNALIKKIIYFKLGNKKEFQSNKRIKKQNRKIGIAQGSALSPLFSNISLKEFDNKMNKKCGKSFIRYVDDFLIISRKEQDVKKLGKYAEKLLEKEGLKLSPSKTEVVNIRDGLVFLGIKFTRTRITTKLNRAQIIQNTQKVLSLKNQDYLKCKNDKERVKDMNFRIQGQVEYYKYYHIGEMIKLMNFVIKSRKNLLPLGLKTINLPKIAPLVEEKNWQALFKLP